MLSKTAARLGVINTHFNKSVIRQQMLYSPLRAFSAGGQYDVCVIGGGPGGYVAAIKAA
jgi:dihydrolipoamide dehydrogenase